MLSLIHWEDVVNAFLWFMAGWILSALRIHLREIWRERRRPNKRSVKR